MLSTGDTKLLIIGGMGGTNVGQSFQWAADELGIEYRICDSNKAFRRKNYIQSLVWRFADHRPLYLNRFSNYVYDEFKHFQPSIILSTGIAPINAKILAEMNNGSAVLVSYLTDDPWNAGLKAKWFFESIRRYNIVFSTRTRNLHELRSIGCNRVYFMPFAYEPRFCYPEIQPLKAETFSDVVFVGGGDKIRGGILSEVVRKGIDLSIYGSYWDRFPILKSSVRGQVAPELLRKATSAAKVAICMLRHANRDGHVMRTFEIAAIGTAMVAEDSEEHRQFLGDSALFFQDSTQLIEAIDVLRQDVTLRRQLASGCFERIVVNGRNTYVDRLKEIIRVAANDTSATTPSS